MLIHHLFQVFGGSFQTTTPPGFPATPSSIPTPQPPSTSAVAAASGVSWWNSDTKKWHETWLHPPKPNGSHLKIGRAPKGDFIFQPLIFQAGGGVYFLNTLDIQGHLLRFGKYTPKNNIPFKQPPNLPAALLDVGKVIQLTDGWQGISQGIHVPDSSVEEVAAVVSRVVVRWGCWKWACGFSGFRCC